MLFRSRARIAQQRGGGATHVPLDELPTLAHRDDEYLQIHDALADLERQDPRLARLDPALRRPVVLGGYAIGVGE